MKKTFRNSLFLGIAALSFVAISGASNPANASSKVNVVSNNALASAPAARNVNTTGKNAIYSKAGVLKGAKVVVSKTTANEMKTATTGQDNLRVYRVAKLSNGSVYYKVVSFDKNYRGWIYGGKSTTNFAGGLSSYNTTEEIPSDYADGKTEYTIPTAYDSTTQNKFFYKAPELTQYRIGRAVDQSGKVISSTDGYKNDKFVLTNAVKTSREGDVWYQISSSNKDLDGSWVPSKALFGSNDTTVPINATAFRLTFKNAAGDKLASVDYTKQTPKSNDTLGSLQEVNGVYTWTMSSSDITALQSKIDTALQGTGYTFKVSDNQSALAIALSGKETTFTINKNNGVYQKLTAYAEDTNNSDSSSVVYSKLSSIPTNSNNPDAFADKVTVPASSANTGLKRDYTIDIGSFINKDGTFNSGAFTKELKTNYLNGTDAQNTARVTAFNSAISQAASKSFIAPAAVTASSDLFGGTAGKSFTDSDLTSYITNHQLTTLKSGVFEQIDSTGTPTFYQIHFNFKDGTNGTFGNSVTKVLYTYDSTNHDRIQTFPVKSQSTATAFYPFG